MLLEAALLVGTPAVSYVGWAGYKNHGRYLVYKTRRRFREWWLARAAPPPTATSALRPTTVKTPQPGPFDPLAFWLWPDWSGGHNLLDRGAQPFWLLPPLGPPQPAPAQQRDARGRFVQQEARLKELSRKEKISKGRERLGLLKNLMQLAEDYLEYNSRCPAGNLLSVEQDQQNDSVWITYTSYSGTTSSAHLAWNTLEAAHKKMAYERKYTHQRKHFSEDVPSEKYAKREKQRVLDSILAELYALDDSDSEDV